MDTPASDGTTPPPYNPPTNLEKELVNKKQKTNRDNNIHTDNIDSKLQATFTFRIPYSLYKKYYELGGTKKKLVINALRHFMFSLVNNVSNVTDIQNENYNFNVNININNIQQSQEKEKEEADVFTAERVKQLKSKLKEAQEVLREYKVKAQGYDRIVHLVGLYRRGTIDAKNLLQRVIEIAGGVVE
ncbi:MAG: hypothetical protein QXM76_01445 [Zestosphaera sp.]